MKRLISAVLILSLVLSLCACGKKKGITMKIRCIYGGYGIAGQDLGHGEVEREITDIREGDFIYEKFDGKLKLDSKEKDGWMMQIKSIEKDCVKLKVAEGVYRPGEPGSPSRTRCTMEYDEEIHFDSMYVVCDGINYDYMISFTK